jgi:hypothetical protein
MARRSMFSARDRISWFTDIGGVCSVTWRTHRGLSIIQAIRIHISHTDITFASCILVIFEPSFCSLVPLANKTAEFRQLVRQELG